MDEQAERDLSVEDVMMCPRSIACRRERHGHLALICWIVASTQVTGAGAPGIELTSVPAYGSSDYLIGRASDAGSSDHAVAVYINVPPYGWWTKPYAAYPLTSILSDGTWACDIVTGGEDAYATEVIAFLVPKTYSPPAAAGDQCLPSALYAFPYARAVRYKQIEFANCDWLVKQSHDPVGPGPNYFSGSEDNLWVDPNGFLHLKVLQQGGAWRCAEAIANRSMGYGRYAFTVSSGIAGLDPEVVLGFFTWEDCVPEHHYREIDIEVSRWGDAGGPNTQFVIQPFDTAGNRHRFEVDPSTAPGGVTTHEFTWEEGRVDFRSYRGGFALNPSADAIIESWSYTGGDVPPPGQENLRLNLWLLDGRAPTDAQNAEVVVSEVTYLPDEPNSVYRFWSPASSHHFYTTGASEKEKLLRGDPNVWTYEGVAYHALATGGRANLLPVYRFWSPQNKAHFYTISESEKTKLLTAYPSSVWTYESIAFYAFAPGQQPPGTTPVYRFWSPKSKAHFYTMKVSEKNKLMAAYPASVWTYEGISWYAYPAW